MSDIYIRKNECGDMTATYIPVIMDLVDKIISEDRIEFRI